MSWAMSDFPSLSFLMVAAAVHGLESLEHRQKCSRHHIGVSFGMPFSPSGIFAFVRLQEWSCGVYEKFKDLPGGEQEC